MKKPFLQAFFLCKESQSVKVWEQTKLIKIKLSDFLYLWEIINFRIIMCESKCGMAIFIISKETIL